MGARATKVARTALAQKEIQVVCMGLDTSGKMELMYRLNLGDLATADLNIDTTNVFGAKSNAKYNNITLLETTLMDYGGRGGGRYFRRALYRRANGVIFVVDALDRAGLPDAKAEFDDMMAEEHLKSVPVLVLANKHNEPEAMTITEIQSTLGLDDLPTTCPWRIQPASTKASNGLREGLDWLSLAITNKMLGSVNLDASAKKQPAANEKGKANAKGSENVSAVQKLVRTLTGHSVAA